MVKGADSPEIAKKREQEKATMEIMVRIYCRGSRHKRTGELCPECEALLSYANSRTDSCPFMETKTFCSACKVHCYSPKMQEKVRQIMRYSGPRMLFVHPVIALRHMKITLQNRRKSHV
ncbi:hypothetical protein HNP82_002152 [Catenibacillus scindens]|uniref:Nitrous oxide-stimulated promoter family protein n=1 Tax=Catenibacillus scindens TaxID=673271 RepID=A0A7W8M594_9FIRM|nr:nitrous oxide-stimulated promoter family protein [Catenibacillus scindens]MBB5265013.1 hypothetical protein [Catenibacillus scindens]